MPTKLSLKEALERPAAPKAGSPDPSGSLGNFALRAAGDIDRPVDVARLLVRHGCSLRNAHAALQRIAAGKRVCLSLQCRDVQDVRRSFRDLSVSAVVLNAPVMSVADVRHALNLTQAEFAVRFGFEAKTVRNWEQGRNLPDPAVSILLAIIARHPDVVDEVMSE